MTTSDLSPAAQATTTTSLSKADWAAVEKELSVPYGGVKLLADGHAISLNVVPIKKLRFSIGVYIDGWIKGEWMKVDSEIGAKFWHPCKMQLFSARDFAEMRRKFGKRYENEMRKKHPPKLCLYSPHWPSVTAFRRHIAKTCRDIRLVSVGYQPESATKEQPA